MASPVGLIEISANAEVITRIRILATETTDRVCAADHLLLAACVNQLEQWFAGTRQSFTLPLQPALTPRGTALRTAIESIGYGDTINYSGLADEIGSSARAVGQACKRNPFPIIIPCHRVTSTSGPEFYSAGHGARTKGWLLRFERSVSGLTGSDRQDQGELSF